MLDNKNMYANCINRHNLKPTSNDINDLFGRYVNEIYSAVLEEKINSLSNAASSYTTNWGHRRRQ
jgi:hypothetical protein